MHSFRVRSIIALAVAGAGYCGMSSQAGAVIAAVANLNNASGPAATAGTTYNYTTEGTADYAFFGNSPTTPDHKAGTTSTLFSGLTAINGNDNSTTSFGGGGDAQSHVTFTDGTPTTSIANSPLFAYANNPAVGAGESFTFTLDGASSDTLRVYAVTYDTRGTLTLTSGGNTLYTDADRALPSPDGTNGGGHGYGLYTFNLSGPAGSVVTVAYTVSTDAGQYSNVGFQGATAASATPEPASVGLLGLGALGLLARRRKTC